MERKHTLVYGIKGKLISAVCMLLVAMIMVVSSTYAWFTLSTAPEVSGISTAIGSNGALEIKLNRDDAATANDENTAYGNIVNLSGDRYGLDDVILYPSTLDLSGNAFGASFLKIPGYGANGKPILTEAKQTDDGTFVNGIGFVARENALGVRAVGMTSGLTARQQAYRDARRAVTTAVQSATNRAKSSLSANADILANIVIKKVANTAYTGDDLATLQAIVTDLELVMGDLETAYEAQIIALAASKLTDDLVAAKKAADPAFTATADDVYAAVQTGIGDTITLSGIKDTGKFTAAGIEFVLNDTTTPENGKAPALYNSIVKYHEALAKVASAKAAATVDDILGYLIDIRNPESDKVTLNGFTIKYAMENQGEVASAVMNAGGPVITMKTGASIYVDIADHCGDYQVGVVIENFEYGSFSFTNVKATMVADSGVSPSYLTNASDAVTANGEPAGTGSGSLPMTQFYGYILDLTFRTNAASSKLLLQVDPIDRIYADGSSQNPETMGGGSYFEYSSSELSINQIRNLMGAIRIVFFDPDDGNAILGYARLAVDVAEVTETGSGVAVTRTVKAEMYMCNADGTTTTDITNAIKELPQNIDTNVSTLVYLEGDPDKGGVENDDVSAVSPQSLIGRMNIQFSSDADLVPMDYADLKKPADTYKVEFKAEGTTIHTVNVPKNQAYSFTLPTEVSDLYNVTGLTYSVGGTDKGAVTEDSGTYTIPVENMTGDVVITINGTLKNANP